MAQSHPPFITRPPTEVPQYATGPLFLNSGASFQFPQGMSDFFNPQSGTTTVGGTAQTGVRRISTTLHIANSETTTLTNYLAAEPLIVYKNSAKTHSEVVKAYTLRRLNNLMCAQHQTLIDLCDINKDPRKRTAGNAALLFDINKLVTVENFTTYLGFVGFVADASSGGAAGNSPQNPGKPSREIGVHIQGKMTAANLWTGGEVDDTSRQGDKTAFVLKHLNRVNDIPSLSGLTLGEILRKIGPLQFMPIATHSGVFSSETFLSPRDVPVRIASMLNAGDYVSGFARSKIHAQIYNSYQTLFSHNNIDNHQISGYRRGTRFAYIPNILEAIQEYKTNPEKFRPNIQYNNGQLFHAGTIVGNYTKVPSAALVADAVCDEDISMIHARRNPLAQLTKDYSNKSHDTLLTTYGTHLDVNLDRGAYHLPENQSSVLSELQNVQLSLTKNQK